MTYAVLRLYYDDVDETTDARVYQWSRSAKDAIADARTLNGDNPWWVRFRAVSSTDAGMWESLTGESLHIEVTV